MTDKLTRREVAAMAVLAVCAGVREAGAPYLVEGEAAVVRPSGLDFEIVARVRHDAWRALARELD